MGWNLRRSVARNRTFKMIHRILVAFLVSAVVAFAQNGVPLEMPAPPAPPETSPIGLLLLSFALSFILLPVSLLAFVVLLLVLVKVLGAFKITPARLLAAVVQSGGVGMLKLLVWPMGLLITVPAALIATGWAARILDHRLDLNDRMVFGCASGVLVAVAFVTFVKRIARGVQQRMLGGAMPGMAGGGMKRAKATDRPKRR